MLVSERKVQICATVSRLLVEDGHYEVALDDTLQPIPAGRAYVQGLINLRPEDAWYVLRAGSQTISWLAAEDGCYRRLVSTSDDDRGYTVIRDEIGVRHGARALPAIEEALDDVALGTKGGGRGSQPIYDWDAARLEACRLIYFEGVPDSFGALIRHVQGWFAEGGRVPDESTMKRRLRDIWAMFGSEAKRTAA